MRVGDSNKRGRDIKGEEGRSETVGEEGERQ